jgi:hypothetical protein
LAEVFNLENNGPILIGLNLQNSIFDHDVSAQLAFSGFLRVFKRVISDFPKIVSGEPQRDSRASKNNSEKSNYSVAVPVNVFTLTAFPHDKRNRDIGNLLWMGDLGCLVLSVFYAVVKGF